MGLLDKARAAAFKAVDKAPGKLGSIARKANDVLGRPLADANELSDRKAFATGGATVTTAVKPSEPTPEVSAVAPVVVYHMDKSRRDSTKLTDMLDAEKIPYRVSNIQEDPAAQMAVKRDSKGYGLPLVVIAGDAIGGRAELANLISSGMLKKRVFGR
jgi:glutaredoxin